MCALQCDKMGAKWNSRFKKVKGLDFSETGPSGSDRQRKTEGWRQNKREREGDDSGNGNKREKAIKPERKEIVEKQENKGGTGDSL